MYLLVSDSSHCPFTQYFSFLGISSMGLSLSWGDFICDQICHFREPVKGFLEWIGEPHDMVSPHQKPNDGDSKEQPLLLARGKEGNRNEGEGGIGNGLWAGVAEEYLQVE